MATFFVGQRVRVTGVTRSRNAYLIGSESRIVRLDDMFGGTAQLELHPLADGSNLILLEHLEPILPSGHQPCDTEFKRDLDRLLEGVAA